jgi:hypothetical protein
MLLLQGRGLFYWALKSNKPSIWKDLLVRGIELGPISYRRRPSTCCRLAYANPLGYSATIAGLEYFDHQRTTSNAISDIYQVRTLPWTSVGKGTDGSPKSASDPLPALSCPELRHGSRGKLE